MNIYEHYNITEEEFDKLSDKETLSLIFEKDVEEYNSRYDKYKKLKVHSLGVFIITLIALFSFPFYSIFLVASLLPILWLFNKAHNDVVSKEKTIKTSIFFHQGTEDKDGYSLLNNYNKDVVREAIGKVKDTKVKEQFLSLL